MVSLVLALAVLAGLAALAISSFGGRDPAARRGPVGVIDDASAVACQADVATLETSIAAVHAATGAYPSSFEELAAAGFPTQVPNRPGFSFAPEVVAGSPTGRVAVNGRPSAEGCQAPEPARR